MGGHPHLPAVIPRIEATPSADAFLAKTPGLRERVEDVLVGILQTGAEIRRLQQGYSFFNDHPDQFMRVRAAGHMVTYTLDLEREVAKVLFVERIRERIPDGSSKAG
jgi:hypothetical protein